MFPCSKFNFTGYSARVGAGLFLVDFVLVITIYLVILRQKKKLEVQNQTGEIQDFNLSVKHPEVSDSIDVYNMPGSAIPADVPPQIEVPQKG